MISINYSFANSLFDFREATLPDILIEKRHSFDDLRLLQKIWSVSRLKQF